MNIVEERKIRRAHRTRSRIHGTAERPRLSINISNRHVIAQLIDDDKSVTLAYVSTVKSAEAKGTLTERAAWAGKTLAATAKKKKIKAVVFDRGAHLYHGRVKALADAARNEGLEF